MKVVLKLTEACNLNCTYCYAKSRAKAPKDDGRALMRSLDRVLEGVPARERSIVFFGGEPLLRFDLIRTIVKRHPDCSFTLNTNGTLVDAPVAKFLGGTGVFVSLAIDGTAAVHDRQRRTARNGATHRIVVEALERLTRAGVPMALRMTVAPKSAAGLAGEVEYLSSIGASRVGIAPAVNMRWDGGAIGTIERSMAGLARRYVESPRRAGLPEIADFERARERRAAACRPGADTITIRSDGTILPCHRSVIAEPSRLVLESDACATCRAAPYCTKCLPKAGAKRPGPRCKLKLAFARAYDIVRAADAGGKRPMEKYTVIDGKIYKIPPEVLKKYQLSEEQALKAQAQSRRPKATKAEPPLKGNWYELGESDCF